MNFKLKNPVSISFNTWTHQENVLVKLIVDGLEGLGEAAPFKPITLDSQDDVIAELASLSSIPLAVDSSPADLHAFLDGKINGHTTRAALDFAFHDIQGKARGVPIYDLYGGVVNRPPNSVTLFIKEAEAMRREAAEALLRYPHLKIMKIKLRGDEQDVERVRAIKNGTGDRVQFVIDANQGFSTPEDALCILPKIREILGDVLIVEEPLPKGRLDDLKRVTENIKDMLVFADESVVDISDARDVIEKHAVHGINIKLQKAGGIWQGREMARLAGQAGLKVMVGCMLEGPLSIAAGVHFAAATSNVILTDLDMDLSMPSHVIGVCPFEDGVRKPLSTPGLGIVYDDVKLRSFVASGELIWERVV